MSRHSKYADQVKALDVSVMRRELLKEFSHYVEFAVTYEKDAVRVTGRSFRVSERPGAAVAGPVASVYRGASSWTNPHLPFWCILSDIYDQLDHERVLRREIAAPLAEGKLPF